MHNQSWILFKTLTEVCVWVRVFLFVINCIFNFRLVHLFLAFENASCSNSKWYRIIIYDAGLDRSIEWLNRKFHPEKSISRLQMCEFLLLLLLLPLFKRFSSKILFTFWKWTVTILAGIFNVGIIFYILIRSILLVRCVCFSITWTKNKQKDMEKYSCIQLTILYSDNWLGICVLYECAWYKACGLIVAIWNTGIFFFVLKK